MQPSRVFLRKGVLKICSKITGEHSCWSVIWIKLWDQLINWNHYISTEIIPMTAIKVCRMGKYSEELPPTTSHDHSITWNSEVTWQINIQLYWTNYHQTWCGGDLQWGASIHKVALPFKHVVTWYHVQIKNIKSPLSQSLW